MKLATRYLCDVASTTDCFPVRTVKDARVVLASEHDALAARLEQAEKLLQEFCDRVDKCEVRSTRTYAKFKQFLEGAQ